VKAFIVAAPGTLPTAQLEESIRAHVKAHLAPYQQPRYIEFVEALPMTTTGKVQRRVLRERDMAPTSSDPPKA
jgi:acetyl-CoA synthetase